MDSEESLVVAASVERRAGLEWHNSVEGDGFVEVVVASSLEREAGLEQCAGREAAVRTLLSAQRSVRQDADCLHQESILRENDFKQLVNAERQLREEVLAQMLRPTELFFIHPGVLFLQARGSPRAQSPTSDRLGSLLAPVERAAALERSAQQQESARQQQGYTTALRAARDALTTADATILKLQGEKVSLVRALGEATQKHDTDLVALKQAWTEIESLRKESEQMKGRLEGCYSFNKNLELVEQRNHGNDHRGPLARSLDHSGDLMRRQMAIRDSINSFKEVHLDRPRPHPY